MSDVETVNSDTTSPLYAPRDMRPSSAVEEPDENTPLISNGPSHAEEDNERKTFSFFSLPSRSKYTMVLCFLASLFVGCAFAILAPFFPKEAEKKGVSSTVIGFIFSIFELVIFISSPVFGNYLTKIGPKFLFASGICVGGCCSILFGLLDKCPSGTPFIIMCFCVRCVEALGLSAFLTASFAILSNEFPNHIATVIGLQETASGVGMMIGPALGGILYEVGGYGLPFFVLGGLIVVNGFCLVGFLPPPVDVKKSRKGSFLKLVSSPMVLVSMLSIVMCSLGISFLDPTLAKHLDPFNLSTAVVGLVFVIAPALYAFFSPVWGYLVDNKNMTGSLIVVGHLIYGISFLCLGPSPWLPFLPFTLWMVVIGAVLIGFSIGCAVIPNMKCLVTGALEVGFEDNIDTYGLVSGLFNSLFCLGGFAGPMAGGAAVGHFGFKVSAGVLGLVNIFVSFIALIFFLPRYLKKRKSDREEEQPSLEGAFRTVVDVTRVRPIQPQGSASVESDEARGSRQAMSQHLSPSPPNV